MTTNRFGPKIKAAVLVPLTALSVAWTGSLLTAGVGVTNASASPTPKSPGQLPDGTTVPNQAIEAPASVSGSLADRGSGIAQTASTNGIPSAAVSAYQRAETVINSADKQCNLPWQLVAAIGRVESDHGRYGGNALDSKGVARPGIYGIPLDGSNDTAEIKDTDAGQYDNDKVYDRAVGPMQFIPSTWSVVGVDSDSDGERNPQDIDDAALATAVYLCSGDDDLGSDAGRRSAVYRYNHSNEYVDLVLSIMESYMTGDFMTVPNGTTSGTSQAGYLSPDPSYVSPAEMAKRKQAREQRARQAAGSGGGSSSGSGGGGGGGTTTTTAPPPAPKPQEPVGEATKKVGETVEKAGETIKKAVPKPPPAPKPVQDTLTYAEAKAQCLAEGVSTLNLAGCISGKLG